MAFQKVSVAYDVLSTPASKRLYDSHPGTAHDFSSAASTGARAEETLRGVVLGVFNDFLDGDLEMIHTLLRESRSQAYPKPVPKHDVHSLIQSPSLRS